LLHDTIVELVEKNTQNYVFIDEVQSVPEFEKMVDSLFVKNDIQKALEIIKKDTEMDDLFIEAQKQLESYIIENAKKNAFEAILVLMVVKYFERIGDHAVNVCEWVHYAETGVNPRHAKKYSREKKNVSS